MNVLTFAEVAVIVANLFGNMGNTDVMHLQIVRGGGHGGGHAAHAVHIAPAHTVHTPVAHQNSAKGIKNNSTKENTPTIEEHHNKHESSLFRYFPPWRISHCNVNNNSGHCKNDEKDEKQ